ncbi:alpha/beta hydrolase [Halalkalibacterium halodurans]|jgi:acetyl esterase|uniref:alpha/beta hydrolase n=1 Tax=Halalkalibacterium halodurans TaxID=86665 RepID=UPI0006A9F992|nr:alpha/beta hydrolase [Halalkalibacterium halodurans]MED4161802.1 alpha/beta hydrolase [Halalkalibacterium halodurans]TPE66676.1 alpha/beta hydrolase [Halalkalibacterium halodurans]
MDRQTIAQKFQERILGLLFYPYHSRILQTFTQKWRDRIDRDRSNALEPSTIPFVQREEKILPTSYGGTRVLIYRPDKTLNSSIPVYVNMHGGGFVMGNAEMDDVWCRVIADRANCVVVNIDYRLAPQHKFPTAVYECYEVVKWLVDHPEQFSITPQKVAIGGHSAGGNLATAVCLLNLERGNELPIIYQIIDYAPLDLHTDPALKPSFKEAIPVKMARLFNASYVETEEDARNPLASPLFAESLQGLPDALVITAERDSLAAEGEQYAERLKQAGVKVTYKDYKGMPHGFTHAGDLAVAEHAWHLMCDKLKEAFSESCGPM